MKYRIPEPGMTISGFADSKKKINSRIYEPLVLVNTVISWIRLADLNPCTMYISLTIFLFRSGIAFIFYSSGHCKAKIYGHISKKSRVGRH
jgi:hypothetical protein